MSFRFIVCQSLASKAGLILNIGVKSFLKGDSHPFSFTNFPREKAAVFPREKFDREQVICDPWNNYFSAGNEQNSFFLNFEAVSEFAD